MVEGAEEGWMMEDGRMGGRRGESLGGSALVVFWVGMEQGSGLLLEYI